MNETQRLIGSFVSGVCLTLLAFTEPIIAIIIVFIVACVAASRTVKSEGTD